VLPFARGWCHAGHTECAATAAVSCEPGLYDTL